MAEGEDRPPITKQTTLREVPDTVDARPHTVGEDEPLTAVAENLCEEQGVHTAAVVDPADRLVGIIPMRIVLDELFLALAPEEFLVEMREMAGVEEFGRISRAQTARELMEEPVYVTMDDTVREAFVRMHEAKLEGLPVVDETMKVVGYLDRFQLLRLWLKGRAEG
ncbi:MAG: CBS domain-containing protein [Dehalococcoidia bacterium]